MKHSSVSVLPKKSGRPATGRDRMFSFRMPDELAAALGRWVAAQPGPMSRSDAMRLIIRDWLISQGLIKVSDDREDLS